MVELAPIQGYVDLKAALTRFLNISETELARIEDQTVQVRYRHYYMANAEVKSPATLVLTTCVIKDADKNALAFGIANRLGTNIKDVSKEHGRRVALGRALKAIQKNATPETAIRVGHKYLRAYEKVGFLEKGASYRKNYNAIAQVPEAYQYLYCFRPAWPPRLAKQE